MGSLWCHAESGFWITSEKCLQDSTQEYGWKYGPQAGIQNSRLGHLERFLIDILKCDLYK